VTLAPSPLGGVVLGEASHDRSIGTVGSADAPPEDVLEAYRRLAEYSAAKRGLDGASSRSVEIGSLRETYDRGANVARPRPAVLGRGGPAAALQEGTVMGILQRLFGRPEARERRSSGMGYVAEIMAARESYISGRRDLGELTATVQVCVSLWKAALAMAKVEPTSSTGGPWP
jgi:hypothetical protein